MSVDEAPEPEAQPEAPAAVERERARFSRAQVVILCLALAALIAIVAYVAGDASGSRDPLNDVDVGFMQDMSYHHDQAVEMSMMLLGKEDIDNDLRQFAYEIIIGQRYEQGIYSATLDRFGHSSDPGATAMEWMGEGSPPEDMAGLATPEQLEQLDAATGEEAEALWIALMSEHHLAGLHMADYAARHGQDETTVNLAQATVKGQRSEIFDIARYRERAGLPIPEGFTDPLADQRLNPISHTSEHD